MIQASQFIDRLRELEYSQYVGVPCSYLRPFINYVIDDPKSDYIGAASEGEAIGIGMGAYLGGRKAVVMCQNSGLGNMVNPLTSLCEPFQIPLLLIVTWRGQPGGKDEPQHELMGRVTPQLLETMEIPWSLFPTEESAIDNVMEKAESHFQATGRPYALLMQKGSVDDFEISNRQHCAAVSDRPESVLGQSNSDEVMNDRDLLTRTEALIRIIDQVSADAAIIATTGKTGRELYTIRDHESQIYVVGGMGTAAGIGFGLAHAQPNRKVVVIDGDGSLLMKMGALATIGFYQPDNLVHVVLDNERHDSTGGQDTVSSIVRFDEIARSANYRQARFSGSSASFDMAIENTLQAAGPVLLHAKIQPGSPKELGRPSIKPHEVKQRMMRFLGSSPTNSAAAAGAVPSGGGIS